MPLLIFAGEDAGSGDYGYTQSDVSNVGIQELGLYNDELWLDKEGFEDKISYELSMDDEYKNLSDEEFKKAVDEKIADTEFAKAIVIYVE